MAWWCTATWEELEKYVNLRRVSNSRSVWLDIDYRPVTPDSVDTLVKRCKLNVLPLNGQGVCMPDIGLILLSDRLDNYERDIVLFHELVHCHYPALNDVKDSPYKDENGVITEWLARKARANFKVLRHAILGFGLEPRIYDLASAMAFYPPHVDFIRQLAFPFAQKYFDELRHIKMD